MPGIKPASSQKQSRVLNLLSHTRNSLLNHSSTQFIYSHCGNFKSYKLQEYKYVLCFFSHTLFSCHRYFLIVYVRSRSISFYGKLKCLHQRIFSAKIACFYFAGQRQKVAHFRTIIISMGLQVQRQSLKISYSYQLFHNIIYSYSYIFIQFYTCMCVSVFVSGKEQTIKSNFVFRVCSFSLFS